MIEKSDESISLDKISELLNHAIDFGEGTENLSEEIDAILYGKFSDGQIPNKSEYL